MVWAKTIKRIQDVVDWGLCIGCGACYYLCHKGAVALVNVDDVGIRAKFESDICGSCTECLTICPGHHLEAPPRLSGSHRADPEVLIGPTLEVWEGYATDSELRYAGASGGVISALSLYCLEKESMDFVLHTAMDERKPWLNTTVQSKSKSELLERSGSRYGPSSPCDSLRAVETSGRPCVFIGKPCDTGAVTMLRKERPHLDSKIGLALTFFCAGPPSARATLNLLGNLDVNPTDVSELRYRGKGWPGSFTVSYGRNQKKSLTYKESWGYLAMHSRSLRCNLCPDGLGELADISCGDAWHRYANNGNPGISLVLVRTERGREILRRATEAGYVELQPSTPSQVITAQGLVQRRKEVFGRLSVMRLFAVPAPGFAGFPLCEAWAGNPPKVKARTILGTMKRIIRRRLWHRNPVFLG